MKTKLHVDETLHHKTGNITSAHTGCEGREKFTCILTELKLFVPQGTKYQLKDTCMPWHASLISLMSINK